MKKDFDSWNFKKKKIEDLDVPNFYPKEREVWWCSLGLNLGIETDGKNEEFRRPVLVLKYFNKEMLWILPLSSQGKDEKFYHRTEWNGEVSYIMVTQIRTISSKRLLRNIRLLPEEEFEEVKKIVKNFI